MVTIRTVAFLIVLLISLVPAAGAITPVADFRCVVQKASSILVVSDRKNDRPILEDEIGPVFITTLTVKKKFHNSAGLISGPKKEFDFILRRNLFDSVGNKLSQSKMNLVFFRYGEKGPEFVGDGVGVLPYNDGVVISGVKLNDKAIALFIKKSAEVKCPLVLQ